MILGYLNMFETNLPWDVKFWQNAMGPQWTHQNKTPACTFSSLIWPGGSAPAALASLLFDPPEPKVIGKNTMFRDFPTFSRIWASFFWLFLFSDLLSSTPSLQSDSSRLCFSSVHIVGSFTPKLPSAMYILCLYYVYTMYILCIYILYIYYIYILYIYYIYILYILYILHKLPNGLEIGPAFSSVFMFMVMFVFVKSLVFATCLYHGDVFWHLISIGIYETCFTAVGVQKCMLKPFQKRNVFWGCSTCIF